MFSFLRRIPFEVPFAILVIALAVVLLFAFGVIHTGSSSSDSVDVLNPGATPYYPLGPPILFNSITDPSGTRYLPDVANPPDSYPASNPITVAMAIGAGLRFEKESEPTQGGYGHLHVFIDQPPPFPGDAVVIDDTHIDLADASHVLTLPTLSPGGHAITAVWTGSDNMAGTEGSATVRLNVSN